MPRSSLSRSAADAIMPPYCTESQTLVANVDLIDAGGSSSYDVTNSSLAKAVAAAHLLPPWAWMLGDPGDNASHRSTEPYSRPTTK
jgi:hypothetical protein